MKLKTKSGYFIYEIMEIFGKRLHLIVNNNVYLDYNIPTNFTNDYEIIYNPKENKMENSIEKQIKELKEKLNILETTYNESKKKDVLIPGKLYWIQTDLAVRSNIYKYSEFVDCNDVSSIKVYHKDYIYFIGLDSISRISELEDDSISNWFSGNLKISDKNLKELL